MFVLLLQVARSEAQNEDMEVDVIGSHPETSAQVRIILLTTNEGSS